MRIIIIGEFSSFSKNLSEGFRQLEHECFVFSWGDNFKKINQDSDNSYCIRQGQLSSKNLWKHIFFAFKSMITSFKLQRKVCEMSKEQKWDVALVINPSFIRKKKAFWKPEFTQKMIESLLFNSSQIYFSACGRDVPYYDFWKDQNWKNKEMISFGISSRYTSKEIHHLQSCLGFINKVIPVMYMYAEAWRRSEYTKNCKVLPTIPLPVDTSKFEEKNNIGVKIVIFHGIIRPKDKGTPYILDAMKRLQKKYPDEVECVAKGGMPLDEYLPLLNRTNILIDQVYADSVGMNGLYALAMGKVVLGGNEPENQKEFGECDCPIINIIPDADQIYAELEKLVKNPNLIKTLSVKSRVYVEKVHDAKTIAKKYIDSFKNN